MRSPVSLLILSASLLASLLVGSGAKASDKDIWEQFPDGSTGKVTEYKGVKDTPIAAYVRKPKGDGPFPVVMMIHGGGESKLGTYALGRMKTAPTANFIAEGWAVYSIDFRPKSPFQPIEWDDACLAVETVRKMPFIDGKRVAMIGGSHGGYNTARVASRCDLSCAIPCAPAAIDLLEVFKAQQGGFKLSPNLERVLTQKEQELGGSMAEIRKDPAKFKHESSLTEVKNVRCPILLISGQNDASSPPAVMETYAKKLKEAGKEVELYLPDNGPHGFYFGRPAIPETDEAAKRAVAFISKHFASAERDRAPALNPKDPRASEPEPPVCYDITKAFPGEIGQYRVSRAARPVEPFEIMDGLYYVGNTQVSAHLLKTTNGLILIDTTMPHEVPWLLESIRKLGFKPSDVKVVIGTHAHLDHIGGHWYFQKHFALQTWLQVEDAAGTEIGMWKPGKLVELDGTISTLSRAFPPFQTDRPLRDGEVVEWGGRKLTFHRAPGHTPGTLMIEFPLESKDGKTYRAGLLGGVSPGRPEFTATCKKLRELNIEVWLGAHPEQNKTLAKAAKLKDGKGPNPFIDPEGWKKFLDMMIARDRKAKPGDSERAPRGVERPTAEPAAVKPGTEEQKPKEPPQNALARLEKSWVEPDKTEPAGTKYKTFSSKTITGDVSYLIYLPPEYDKDEKKRYPVLYWLHGTGGKQWGIGRIAVPSLDQAIRDGKAPPMIGILVNGLRGATMYCDTKDGKWPLESVIINDLMPHIDATYRTIAKREARAVEGFSMGGFGAAHLGFKYPEVFGVVSILAPALLTGPDLTVSKPQGRWQEHFSFVFHEDFHLYQSNNPFQLAAKNVERLRGRSIIRLVPHDEASKWLIPRCEELHAVLEKHKIPHEFDVRRDVTTHNFTLVYRALGERAFGFYAEAFAAIPNAAPAKKNPIAKKEDAPKKEPPKPPDQPAAPPDERVLTLFKKLDTNNDGKIAGDETKSEPAKRFLRMFDRNGDGIVTREELANQQGPKPSEPSKPEKPEAAVAGHKWVDRSAADKTTAKTFRSDTIKGDVSYVIYLPPSYDKEQDRRYPVVYWLHGGRGSQRDCGKFVAVTDKAIRHDKCPEMIIVGVNGLGGNNEFPGSQYSDWKDGSLPMESVIVKDLLPHIDKTYRTLGTREGRALEGFSMGGHGALHLAFRHPDLFGVVTGIGPALIMPGDGGNRVQWVYEKGACKGDKDYWLTHDPLTVVEKNAEKIRGKMFIRLITGEVEGNFTHRRTVELGKALEKLKIQHEFVRPGETGHNYVKVYEAMDKGYEFYGTAFPQAR